jgi:hypothetical protein
VRANSRSSAKSRPPRRRARQVAQEAHHLGRRAGHLRHQRHFGGVGVAEQFGFFLAQLQQLAHQRAVVELGWPELAGAGGVGGVDLLAQRAVLRVLHHRDEARHVQREFVAGLAGGLGGGACSLFHVVGQAGQFVFIGEAGVTVGRVQHVFGKFLAEFGLPVLQFGKAGLGRALQLGARELEVTHRVAHGLAARSAQAGRARVREHHLVLGEQRFVGADAGVEVDHLGHVLVVGRAQLGRVGHRAQVANGAPGTRQPLTGHVEHGRECVVVGRHGVAGGLGQRGVGLEQQGIDSRRDVLGPDLCKAWQAGGVEQGVRCCVHGFVSFRLRCVRRLRSC